MVLQRSHRCTGAHVRRCAYEANALREEVINSDLNRDFRLDSKSRTRDGKFIRFQTPLYCGSRKKVEDGVGDCVDGLAKLSWALFNFH